MNEILPSPLLYLSAFFEATREEYYNRLFHVSRDGLWNEWLVYFLNGVALQSEDVLSRAERINVLLIEWKLRTASSASSDVPVNIIDRFATNPYLTIKKITEELGVAYSTAQRGIAKLEKENIIKQVSDAKRDKLYCATEILFILEEPAKIYADLEE